MRQSLSERLPLKYVILWRVYFVRARLLSR